MPRRRSQKSQREPSQREPSQPAPRHRDTVRALLRESIVAAARELTIARGWDAVRMADVAAAAGVSRQTVYNEFASKDGLADVLATTEVERFLAAVRSELHARHGLRDAVQAAVSRVLRDAEDNPLIKAILTSARGGSDELLPFLTTRSDVVLAAATAVIEQWANQRLTNVAAADVSAFADAMVRLVVSHIVLPAAPADQTAAALAELAVRFAAGPVRRSAGDRGLTSRS